MATVVRMPSILAGADEAALNKWLVDVGGRVTSGEPLAELETEKAVVEYAAETDGILGRILVPEGVSAEIGMPIAVVIADGENEADIDAAVLAAGGDVGAGATDASVASSENPIVEAAATKSTESVADASTLQPVSSSTRLFASPLARKLAKDHGIDLALVQGSGPGGRIVRIDIDAAIQSQGTTPRVHEQTSQASHGNGVSEATAEPRLIPLTGMRKAIARRLTESKTTIPHFYLSTDCRVDALLDLRREVNELASQRVSVNDLVILAVARAFQDVPEANVTWSSDGIWEHGSVDISIAVSTEGGLVTPVLRDAGRKSLTMISAEVSDLAVRAREKKLRQDEIEGGSFSISNLGMYDTLEFAAIINPPQSGILAVGAAKQQAVVSDGQLVVATVMRCTLSADHRAVDGALAARWLAAFTHRMEHPLTMLV